MSRGLESSQAQWDNLLAMCWLLFHLRHMRPFLILSPLPRLLILSLILILILILAILMILLIPFMCLLLLPLMSLSLLHRIVISRLLLLLLHLALCLVFLLHQTPYSREIGDKLYVLRSLRSVLFRKCWI